MDMFVGSKSSSYPRARKLVLCFFEFKWCGLCSVVMLIPFVVLFIVEERIIMWQKF
jgi:hypothetical protein